MDNLVLDKAINLLKVNKDSWSNLTIAEKIPLFQSITTKTVEVAKDWADAANQAKSISKDSPLSGEEWTSGPWALIYGVESMVGTLKALESGENPPIGKIRSRPDGQLVANIFPYNIYQRLLLSGIKAEVWMQKSVNENNLNDHIAQIYKSTSQNGHVSLVLGGAIVSSILTLDVLVRLYALTLVSSLNFHPVNHYLKYIFDMFIEYLISPDTV